MATRFVTPDSLLVIEGKLRLLAPRVKRIVELRRRGSDEDALVLAHDVMDDLLALADQVSTIRIPIEVTQP